MSEVTEPLSSRDAENATNNSKKHYKKVAKLLEVIFAKLREKDIKIEHKKVKVVENGRTVYEAVEGEKEPKTNKITSELAEQLELAITNPREFEGNLTISVGKKKSTRSKTARS